MDHSHERPHLRLPNFDYTGKAFYFLTICTQNRECLFGDVVGGEMILNDMGSIVQEEWLRSSEIRREVSLHEFVIMPNHLHGIVQFEKEEEDANSRLHLQRYNSPRLPRSLSSFLAGFKSTSTRKVNEWRQRSGQLLWQANVYEHVIRSEQSAYAIARYIVSNPLKWDLDRDNPSNW